MVSSKSGILRRCVFAMDRRAERDRVAGMKTNTNTKLKISNGKYVVIGSESQVAMTEMRANLNRARGFYKPAKFSNGCSALVVWQVKTKAEALDLLKRSEVMMAEVSGRIGRWIAPSFVVAETREINAR